jgi:putative hemolysin
MDPRVLALLIVLVLVLFNGFFAMSEMAVLTSRKSRLKQMARTSRGARKALTWPSTPKASCPPCSCGISLLSLLTGYFGGESMGGRSPAHCATCRCWRPTRTRSASPRLPGDAVLVGLIGELVPKRIGTLRPRPSPARSPIRWTSSRPSPSPWSIALSACTRCACACSASAPAGLDRHRRRDPLLVSEGHEQGVIDADERNMMNRVMRLGDRTAEA